MLEIFVLTIPVVIVFLVMSALMRRRAFADADAATRAWLEEVTEGDSFDTRSEAIEVLDDRVQASKSLAILQRLTIIAPLLGVIITAIALMVNPTESETVSEVLDNVKPLFSGVLAGAALSIINQFVVIGCLAAIRDLRDRAVQSLKDADFDGATGPGELAAEDLVKGAKVLRDAMGTLCSQSKKLASIQEQLITQGAASMNQLLKSCHQLQTKADSLELPRVEQIDEASERIGEAVKGLSEAMAQADAVLRTQVDEHYRALQDSRALMEERLAKESAEANERFRDAAKSFVDKTAAAAKRMEGAVDRLNGRIEESLDSAVDSLTSTFREAADSETRRFKGQAEQIATAVAGMAAAAEGVQSLSDSFERLSGSFESGSKSIEEQEKIASRLAASSSELSKASDQLARSVVELEAKGVSSLTTAVQSMNTIAEAVVPAMESLSGAPKDLRATLDGIRKSAEESAAVLERVEAFTAKAAKHAETAAAQSAKRGWFGRGGES